MLSLLRGLVAVAWCAGAQTSVNVSTYEEFASAVAAHGDVAIFVDVDVVVFAGEIVVRGNVSVASGHATLDGGGATRLFRVEAGGVLVLRDTGLARGFALGGGGGVDCDAGTCLLYTSPSPRDRG